MCSREIFFCKEDLCMVSIVYSPDQLPLIQFIESDDLFLQDEPQALWFDVLRKLDYRQFQATAARYYEQLWEFNQRQTQERIERRENPPAANPETQSQATARLLFGRATLDEHAPVLYEVAACPRPSFTVRPDTLHPGVTPPRFAGRPPKCFFALLKAFVGVMLAGQPAEPQFVDQKLRENPAFARTCGFTIPQTGKPERASDIPSLRKLQQFDQIMTQSGLWGEAALDRVAANLRAGTVRVESTVVHDTTHYRAYSAMQVLDLPSGPAGGEDVSEPATGDTTDSVLEPSGKRRDGVPVERAAAVPGPASDIPLSCSASGMTRSIFCSPRRKMNSASRCAKAATCARAVIAASRAAVKSRSRSPVCPGWIRNVPNSRSGS
jgi:hypothetical protein